MHNKLETLNNWNVWILDVMSILPEEISKVIGGLSRVLVDLVETVCPFQTN